MCASANEAEGNNMNMPTRNSKHAPWLLALLLALSACGGADEGTAGSSAAASNTALPMSASSPAVDDATISAKVRLVLAKDEALTGMPINIDTQNGVVTLSGPALTTAVRARASQLARSVPGVTGVNDRFAQKSG
jgi:hyperosmotically inducible protein